MLAFSCVLEFKDYRVDGFTSAGNPLLSYGKILRSIYNRANPTRSKWPPCLPVQYISLAVVKKERPTSAQCLNEFTRSTLHGGDVDQILHHKEPMDMQDILKIDGQQQKLARCVVMEGAPGIGKSTFAWELCHQWKEILALKIYSAVVFVSLREKSAQQAKSIRDLMPLAPSAEVISTIKRQHGAGILWVLDGLDELPGYQHKEGSIYLNLITGKLLPHSSIIVTTRPSVTAELFEGYQHCIDKRVEILGFNTQNVIQYARSYFHEDRSMFLSFIICFLLNEGNQKILQQLMYVPMNLAIFCLLHEERFQDITTSFYTATELYNTLTCSLIKRHLIDKFQNRLRIPELLSERNIESYLPHEYQAVFKKLLSIAHKSIVQSQDAIVVFNNLGEDFEHLGLMNCVSSLSLTQGGSVLTHQFVHLTLQEYLAALHHVLTQQPFEALCTKSTQAAIFFVGIADKVDKKSVSPAFLYIQEKMKPENVNVFYDEDWEPEEIGEIYDYHDLKWNHLFLECFLQCSDFIMENEVHVSLREFCSPFYYNILGQLLSQYENVKASVTIADPFQFHHFLMEISSENQIRGSVTYFRLMLTIFDIHKSGLQKLVSFDAIKSMQLIINQYNDLFSGATTLNNLQELILWGNDNSIKQHCLKVLSKVSSLKKIYVFGFTTLVSNSCIESFNSASCLKRLNILPEFDSVHTLNDFIASVFGFSSLEVLILRRVDFKECKDTIIRQLATNMNIKELTLVCCRVTKAMVEAVSANECLEEFGLYDDDFYRHIPPPANPRIQFDIDDSGVIPGLINLVKTCLPPLTTIALQYKHFTTEACIEIALGALCNEKLTRMTLYDVTVNAYYHALNQQQSSSDDHRIIKEKFHIIEVEKRDRLNFMYYVLYNYPFEIAARIINDLDLLSTSS